jgi:hypothetical protein
MFPRKRQPEGSLIITRETPSPAPISAEPAFRAHASGLIVPAEISRARDVFTDSESRTINRAVTLLNRHGIEVYFGCPLEGCKKAPMEPRRLANGDFVLECAHASHVFTRAF